MVVLREYQQRAVDDVRSHWRGGVRSVCLVAPTGAGKTRMGEELASEGRVLWVAHRRELVTQTVERLAERFGRSDVGCVMAGEEFRPSARIQVGTVQTLLARAPDLGEVKTVSLDECHHYISTEWQGIRDAYSNANAFGLTATPERRDGTPMGDVFGQMVVARSYSELVADGVLVPARVYRPARRLGSDLAQDPIEAWLAHGEGAQTFLFAPRVDKAREYASRFNSIGIRAAIIHANTPKIERDDIMRSFRAGTIRVLTNVNVLTEGVDVPGAACAVLANGFGYVGGYLQTVGRVLRSCPGKTHAIVIDLCGTTHKHGMPTDDRRYSLEGRAISSREPPPDGFSPVEYTFSQKVVGEPLLLAEDRSSTPPPPVLQVVRSEDEMRREDFDRMVAVAESKGVGANYASLRFRSKYGVWPPSNWMRGVGMGGERR